MGPTALPVAVSACSCSATCAAVGRLPGSAAVHAATSAATAAGQSAGACRPRIPPRTGTSPVHSSHRTTPKLKMSACRRNAALETFRRSTHHNPDALRLLCNGWADGRGSSCCC